MFFNTFANTLKPLEFQALRNEYKVGGMWEDDDYIMNTLTIRVSKNIIVD